MFGNIIGALFFSNLVLVCKILTLNLLTATTIGETSLRYIVMTDEYDVIAINHKIPMTISYEGNGV